MLTCRQAWAIADRKALNKSLDLYQSCVVGEYRETCEPYEAAYFAAKAQSYAAALDYCFPAVAS